MTTKITNNSRRRVLIQLVHPTFLKKRWGYQKITVGTFTHDPITGKKGRLEIQQKCSGVLTLRAGESRGGLPDEISAVPDVRRLLAAGKIKIELEEDRAKPLKDTKESPKVAKKAGARTGK